MTNEELQLKMLERVYFGNCFFMWRQTHGHRPRLDPFIKPSPEQVEAYMVSSQFWFASLYVLIEGWRDLKLSDPDIDQLLTSEHVDGLRLFRNATFHFQKSDGKQQQWINMDRFNWAEALMTKLVEWFDRQNAG